MTIYDFSKVPSELMTVIPEEGMYLNAGRLHNLFLNIVNNVFSEIGFDSDPAIAGQSVVNSSIEAERNKILPSGSADIITKGVTSFLASKSFAEGSEVWNSLLKESNANPDYKDTQLIAVLSIAYYSSRFWTYAIIRWNNSEVPFNHNATQSHFRWPRWIRVVLSDLQGAIEGGAAGAEVAAVTGAGAAVGAAVGAVVGGVAASANLQPD